MDYCVISGHSFRCKKISVSREKIWSKNTGRTTDGTMTGDIVAIKKKYVIEMPPMSGAEVALLDGLLSEPFFTAKLKNPQTNTIVEDTKATFNRFDYIFSESIKSVDYALNTVVIKCHTAMAQAACEVFDSLKWDGVVGTIAGENTIFILMRTEDMAHKLNDKLKQYIK